MRWSDEEYEYRQEVRDKSITARSARKMRTHNGKGGAVKFPSDYLTPKERKAMNGELIITNLNRPLTWNSFKEVSADTKREYIQMIRERFGAPDAYIAEMMGCSRRTLNLELTDLGCNAGKGGVRKWAKDEFEAWCRGEEFKTNEEAVESEMTAEDETSENPAENAPVEPVAPAEPDGMCVRIPDIPGIIVPESGTLSFTDHANASLANIMAILKNKRVHLTVNWTIIKEE